MQHLDVAGGTGDVAFRVLKAIRAAEAEASHTSTSAPRVLSKPSSVIAVGFCNALSEYSDNGFRERKMA